jgi:5-methylcytosine-specific restriction protein A
MSFRSHKSEYEKLPETANFDRLGQFSVSTTVPIKATLSEVDEEFEKGLRKALKASPEERKNKLEKAPKKPEKMTVTTTVFIRNPYVVVEVLDRAKGICERCRIKAPFNRRSNGSPYLEVHHRTPLSQRGEDTVTNAIALCPNCHRELHFGTIA